MHLGVRAERKDSRWENMELWSKNDWEMLFINGISQGSARVMSLHLFENLYPHKFPVVVFFFSPSSYIFSKHAKQYFCITRAQKVFAMELYYKSCLFLFLPFRLTLLILTVSILEWGLVLACTVVWVAQVDWQTTGRKLPAITLSRIGHESNAQWGRDPTHGYISRKFWTFCNRFNLMYLPSANSPTYSIWHKLKLSWLFWVTKKYSPKYDIKKYSPKCKL